MEKKTILFTLLIFLFSSCSSEDLSKPADLISKSQNKYRIATIVKVDGIAWFSRMREGVHKFAAETGHDSYLVGPPIADGKLQAQLIEKAIEEEVDAICVVPYDVKAVEPVLKKAREKGIVVITHEASNLVNSDLIIEAFDNSMFGAHMMDHLASYMGKEGEYIVFIGSYGSKTHIEWQTAAVARQKEKYPQMKQFGDWIECKDDQAIVHSETKAAIKNNPNLKGVLGAPMAVAAGAGLAVEEAGLEDTISVVSPSLVSVCATHIENGGVDLISFWDPADAGYIMNLLAVMILENIPINDNMDLRVHGYRAIRQDSKKKNLFYGSAWTDVTKDNMNDYPF